MTLSFKMHCNPNIDRTLIVYHKDRFDFHLFIFFKNNTGRDCPHTCFGVVQVLVWVTCQSSDFIFVDNLFSLHNEEIHSQHSRVNLLLCGIKGVI